ncbi:unnamed protein product [Diamesa serratosioi]
MKCENSNEEFVVPTLKKDLQNAKLFLQNCSLESGDSLYDHLSNVIGKVIDERPKNVVDYFEEFSQCVREEKFRLNEIILEKAYQEPERLAFAKKILPSLINFKPNSMYDVEKTLQEDEIDEEENVKDEDEEEEDDDDEVKVFTEIPKYDFMEQQFHWNSIGIGFANDETFLLSCALAHLGENSSIATYHFWGQIYGLHNNYFIAECTLTEAAIEERIDFIETAINIQSLSVSNEELVTLRNSKAKVSNELVVNVETTDVVSYQSMVKEISKKYPKQWQFVEKTPQSTYKIPTEIPAEETGNGVNRNVYFVCNNPGDDWIELPPVTPSQIQSARHIKKMLSGCLDSAICSYPIFPGTEQNYLRCLIARISAATHISPKGFFKADFNLKQSDDESDEGEEEDSDDENVKENPKYKAMSLQKLLLLENWVHHKAYILKQGRVSWLNVNVLENKKDIKDNVHDVHDDDTDGESNVESDLDAVAEADKNVNEINPELHVPLFTSCSNDITNGEFALWNIKMRNLESPIVVVKSNLWPGAFSFAKGRKFDNIYIGYGHKFSCSSYTPEPLPTLEIEYPMAPVMLEVIDPNVEEEQSYELKINNDDGETDDDVDDAATAAASSVEMD